MAKPTSLWSLAVLLLAAAARGASALATPDAAAAAAAAAAELPQEEVAARAPVAAAAAAAADMEGDAAVAPELVARADHSRDGLLWCGNFATGTRKTAAGLLTDLDAGARGKISSKRFGVAAGTCQRVHCWDTTAVYVCNDAPWHLSLLGNDIWDQANDVYKNCCWGGGMDNSGGSFEPRLGLSGQKFVREGGRNFNVIIGYGNCRHPTAVRPSQEGGGGVNWGCKGGILNPLISSTF